MYHYLWDKFSETMWKWKCIVLNALMNLMQKILNKILVKRIQQYIELYT